jgi:hypothetical protein
VSPESRWCQASAARKALCEQGRCRDCKLKEGPSESLVPRTHDLPVSLLDKAIPTRRLQKPWPIATRKEQPTSAGQLRGPVSFGCPCICTSAPIFGQGEVQKDWKGAGEGQGNQSTLLRLRETLKARVARGRTAGAPVSMQLSPGSHSQSPPSLPAGLESRPTQPCSNHSSSVCIMRPPKEMTNDEGVWQTRAVRAQWLNWQRVVAACNPPSPPVSGSAACLGQDRVGPCGWLRHCRILQAAVNEPAKHGFRGS